MRPRQSSLGIVCASVGTASYIELGTLPAASMRPRQSSLGITRGIRSCQGMTGLPCFNEAEAIKPRNPPRSSTSYNQDAHRQLQ